MQIKNSNIIDQIFKMAKVRGADKTFCLSAIARKLDPKNRQQYMKKVRECGKELIQKMNKSTHKKEKLSILTKLKVLFGLV